MASSLPPVKNAAFTFDLALVSQADTDVFQTSVTLAAGDIQVSKDGGAFANITTLPTEIGTSGVLPVALSATEMNADRVTVRCHDAAGDEWQDALVTIYTAAQTLDTTDGVADAVKAKTDNLPSDPAATGDIPSAGTVADAVHDEMLAGHLTPGSAGAALAGAGGAADPLANPVPGAYAEGTAGAALGRVDVAVSSRLASTGAGSVTLVSPVSSAGDVEIYQGDDYHSGDGRALEWTNTAGTWPDLTGATVTFAVRAPNGSLFSTTGTVVTPTGSQVVRVELTAAQTALLLDWPVGSDMRLRATLANGRKATLLRGELAAVADIMTVES